MHTDPPTIALVGCGRWGRHILRDLVALGADVPVVARSAASVDRARQGGASTVVATVDDLPAIDGAVVATPTSGHADAIRALASRGVPVFVEKPMTADLGSAREVVDLIGDRLIVMDKWRYHPGVEALRDIAGSGELGAVRRLALVRDQWASPHRDVDTIWIHLPHDLAITLEILGTIPPVTSAVAERIGAEVTGIDAVLGGGSVMLAHHMSVPTWRREVRVLGDDGVAVLTDGYADHVVVHKGPPDKAREPERRPVGDALPLLLELQAFVTHLRGGPAPRSSAAEGLLVVERIAALRTAAGIAP